MDGVVEQPCGCAEGPNWIETCDKHSLEIIERKLEEFPMLRDYVRPEKRCCSSHQRQDAREQLIELYGRPAWQAWDTIQTWRWLRGEGD